MIASLMAIGAALPAGAAIDTSSSCPSSIPSAGFTDIGSFDATTQQAINCLAAYDITKGTSATTYSPANPVARWQMALFLVRQAAIHGVTIPDGSDQGFTDLGGLSAEAVLAVNQLAQLDITQGTSATTFAPFANVTRWQMALFLTRLVDAAGVTLPSGADQGFTDIGGLSAEAQLAINQTNQLGIADGTSATTYDPLSNTLRWQMALFLTRTLAADGITPPFVTNFTFNPSGDLEVDSDTEQQFTVSGLTPGDDYQVALIDSDAVDTSGSTVVFDDDDPNNNEADDLGNEFNGSADAITRANGVDITDTNETEVTADSDGELTVTVASDAFESFYIIVFGDDDGDNDLDLNADNEANEDFGLSGKIDILAPEAPNGDTDTVEVIAVGADFFVGDDDTTAATGTVNTFFFDPADDNEYDGTNTSSANFMAWLTVDDNVAVTNYSRSAGSTFNITVDIPNAPDGVTATDGDFDEDSGDTDDNDVRVTWNAADGGSIDDYEVTLYEEDSDDDTDCSAGVMVGVTLLDSDSATEGNDGADREVVWVDLADDEYCAVVQAVSDTGDNSDDSDDAASAVVTVDTGETSAPEIDDLDITTDAGTTGLLDGGDVLRFVFNESMDADLGLTSATFFRVSDSDSVYQIACEVQTGAGGCAQSMTSGNADDTLTVTLAGALQFISGTENGINLLDVPTVSAVSSTWDDLAGNQLSLANSTDVTID